MFVSSTVQILRRPPSYLQCQRPLRFCTESHAVPVTAHTRANALRDESGGGPGQGQPPAQKEGPEVELAAIAAAPAAVRR